MPKYKQSAFLIWIFFNFNLNFYSNKDIAREEFKEVIDEIEKDFEKQYNQLKKQHLDYLNHSNEQISNLQNQINQLLKQQQTQSKNFNFLDIKINA